jgi:hypothetical protein
MLTVEKSSRGRALILYSGLPAHYDRSFDITRTSESRRTLRDQDLKLSRRLASFRHLSSR